MASAMNGFSLLNLKPPTSLSKPRNLSLNFAKTAPSLQIRADSMATERLGIKVEKNPPESKLTELGVRQWPKWGCGPSKFPWTYSDKETCYLLEGKVKVTPAGSDEGVRLGAGDLGCVPGQEELQLEDVSIAVDKHYKFG
ncbi:hypothetical protein SDJN02_13940 [Cucurbita argyrosperma subsp. argyrosperma]|nr:hypothetical protein SDJN02_13940 [Cucurbita argyrosperma subsp. argyrosperma]